MEENRVLKEQVQGRRLRLTDDQRRRLAAKGERLDLQFELGSAAGPDRRCLALAHPTSSSSSAFCVWRRFSAWSQIS